MKKTRLQKFLDIDPDSPIFWFRAGCMATTCIFAYGMQLYLDTRSIFAWSLTDWLLSLILPVIAACFAGEFVGCVESTFFSKISSDNRFVMVVFGIIGGIVFLLLCALLLWLFLSSGWSSFQSIY